MMLLLLPSLIVCCCLSCIGTRVSSEYSNCRHRPGRFDSFLRSFYACSCSLTNNKFYTFVLLGNACRTSGIIVHNTNARRVIFPRRASWRFINSHFESSSLWSPPEFEPVELFVPRTDTADASITILSVAFFSCGGRKDEPHKQLLCLF